MVSFGPDEVLSWCKVQREMAATRGLHRAIDGALILAIGILIGSIYF